MTTKEEEHSRLLKNIKICPTTTEDEDKLQEIAETFLDLYAQGEDADNNIILKIVRDSVALAEEFLGEQFH